MKKTLLADQKSAPFVSALEEKKGVKFGALADLLKADKWDVVTIQQQSMAGAKAGTFEPWAGQLVKAIQLYRERRPADAVKDDCVSGGSDTKHLNDKGKYLQACVWLQTLFPKADVTKISYNGKFKPEFAKLARACARDAAAK